jgi:hypothetical protein
MNFMPLGDLRAEVTLLARWTARELAKDRSVASRSRLVVLAWCWLGLGGGRFLGAVVDGHPGLRGWVFIASELAGIAPCVHVRAAGLAKRLLGRSSSWLH